jgi:hypothetical protein
VWVGRGDCAGPWRCCASIEVPTAIPAGSSQCRAGVASAWPLPWPSCLATVCRTPCGRRSKRAGSSSGRGASPVPRLCDPSARGGRQSRLFLVTCTWPEALRPVVRAYPHCSTSFSFRPLRRPCRPSPWAPHSLGGPRGMETSDAPRRSVHPPCPQACPATGVPKVRSYDVLCPSRHTILPQLRTLLAASARNARATESLPPQDRPPPRPVPPQEHHCWTWGGRLVFLGRLSLPLRESPIGPERTDHPGLASRGTMRRARRGCIA